jgi:hypothetical protein
MPWLYVQRLRAKYYRQFDEQLADTLNADERTRSKAGFSFCKVSR